MGTTKATDYMITKPKHEAQIRINADMSTHAIKGYLLWTEEREILLVLKPDLLR